MSKVLYGLGVLIFSCLIVYFYWSISAFLIVLVVSICLLLLFKTSLDFINIYFLRRKFLLAKHHFINQRKIENQRKMSIFHKRPSASGGDESVFDSGLLSNYDSRRSRNSIKSNDVTSPLRSFSRLNSSSRDENLNSKQAFSPSRNTLSPARTIISSMRSSPLSHSKRCNLNVDQHEEESFKSHSSLLHEDTLFTGSPSSISKRRNSQLIEFSAGSGFVSKITATANEMKIHEFPWVAPTAPIIPVIQTPSKTISFPSHGRTDKSFVDSGCDTPKRNRVRVRLAGPNHSDISLNGSSHDLSSNLDNSYTTKSVIQVLKEISRKRAFTPTDDEEHQEAKRRQEHNLYLTRLDCEEENPVPSRNSAEDDRKRVREPDWDTPNVAGPKRRRKNTHIVNNEILSSLSSSIGLQLMHPKPERQKQTISIGTQVTLLKDSPDKKHSERAAQTNISKEVKETGTMPDPPPQPRPRSPVKEKVVTDLNGILKSALSKFNIMPKEGSKVSEETPSSLSTPFATNVNEISSGITPKVSGAISVSNPILSTGLTNQPNQNSTEGTQQGFGSQSSAFMLPVSSAPNVTFGTPISLSSKTSEKVETVSVDTVKTPETPNTISKLLAGDKKDESKKELGGFKYNSPIETPKNNSPFTFGTQANTSIPAPSLTPESTKKGEAFKIPVVSTSASIPSSSAQPIFSFGLPKSENASKVTTTSSVTSTTQPTSTLQISQANSMPLVPVSSGNHVPKTPEPFKFGTTGFVNKAQSAEKNEQPKEEKKEVGSVAMFSFGKPENKPVSNAEKSDNKPFQFTFGQTASQSKETVSNPFTQSAVTSSTTTTTTALSTNNKNPVFTFPNSIQKKDEKPGGFSFKLPSSSSTTGEQKQVFSFVGAPTCTPANTTVSGTGAASDTKPIFPASLFGTPNNSTTVTNAPTASALTVSTSSNTNNAFTSSTTFGTAASDPGKSFNTTTAAATFGSITSTFGSGNKNIFGSNPTTTTNSTSLFTPAASSNPTVGSSIFGSSNTSATAFSTTTPAFGTVASTSNSVRTFGSATSGSTPSFGNPATTTAPTFGSATSTPTFGSSNTPTPSFGSAAPGSTSTPGFANTTPAGSSVPVFGNTLATTTTPAFGATSTSTPSFGSVQTTNATIFGASTTGTTAPAFGSGGTSSFGSTTTVGPAVTPFGSTSSTPTFGASTTPAFGGTSSTSAPAFGSQPQGFGNQTGTTFGSTPAFGQSTTPLFGGSSTFGNQNSTPAFGSSGAFGNTSSTFSATPTPAVPAFGSTNTAFGSTPAFGTQEANKPFTFNAPSSQPTTASGFNFTAQQQPQSSSGGLFQFGAPANSQPGQPFQFNAAQPNSTVGGTGQQMFSIGSGSTAPRRVTGRRKK